MSKTIPAGHITTLAGRVERLLWALKLTRRDAQVFRYCSGPNNKTIGGNLYLAAPGFTVSNLTCTEGADVVDTLNLTMIAQSDLQQADFLTGRWNGTLVEFNEFDWRIPADGFIGWPTYRVSDVTPVAGAFVLEMRDLRVTWQQNYTLYTGKECQNRLGDFRCLVDLTPYTHTFEVVAVSSARYAFTIDVGQTGAYFANGIIRLDAPHLHYGLDLLILDAAGDAITLAVPVIQDIEVGMTGTAIAGCLHRLEDCRDKFDNVLNMRAPGVHAPTVEELVGG